MWAAPERQQLQEVDGQLAGFVLNADAHQMVPCLVRIFFSFCDPSPRERASPYPPLSYLLVCIVD